MPNQSSNSTATALRDVVNKMGLPKAIVSSDGGEFKERFKHILDAEGIDHIVMTTDLSFIDRFIRTIKSMLFERVEHIKKGWHLLFPAVIKQYKIQHMIQPKLNLLM